MIRRAIVAVLLGAAASVANAQVQATFDVVIANGPHAGTYKLTSLAPCGLAEDIPATFSRTIEAQYDESAEASKRALHDPKALNAVILELHEWKGSGPAKSGWVKIIFGPMKDAEPASPASASYEVNTRARPSQGKGAFTGAAGPDAASATFDGQTAKGIRFRVVMRCNDPLP